jgi:F420H(2)-dependent quinone reductase
LLLTTIGSLSGRPHTVPLLYLRRGDEFIVIASYGGRPQDPDWYVNLMANPVAHVQVTDRSFEVEARTTSGSERSELWARVAEAYAGYVEYQARTEREIPIVALTPVGP